MYVRYPLSLRNGRGSPLFERGVDICHEPVRSGGTGSGRCSPASIGRRRVPHIRAYLHWKWHLDEVCVKNNSEMRYL
jgi:putative transposase